ncbi:MAG: hypothetical protein Q8O22_03820 [Candidatus Omnitrophota bacterium]|nr:hypothetical protein [Candidatus Omnitrophota bacterium]
MLKNDRYKYWLVFASSAAVFAYLLHLSWFKWGDLIVDTGREMYAPLRICSGDILYRNFYYIYGPFSPYLNALFFKALGIKLSSLVACGIITAAFAGFLVYKVSRIFLGKFCSTLALWTFFIVFAFGQYVYYGNYNFIVPYSYGAIHALSFALAALYFFYGWLRGGRQAGLLTALFITLALLSKIEVGLSTVAAAACGSMLRGKARFKAGLAFVIAPLSVLGIVYLLFSLKPGGLGEPLAGLLRAIQPNASIPGWLSGAANLKENGLIILKSLFNYVVLIVFFAVGGFVVDRMGRGGFKTRPYVFVVMVSAIFIAIGCFFVKKFFPFDWQYRPLPVFLALAISALLPVVVIVKTEAEKNKLLTLFCLALLSFLLLVRTFFFVRPGHYGFYLLVPGMIFYYVLFLEVIPRFLPAAVNKAFFKIAFSAVFIIFIAGHFSLSRFCYDNKTLKVATAAGTVSNFFNSREENCSKLIEYLRQETAAEDTLVVFPEGPMINFMAQRRNPLYYCMYMPLDLNKQGVTNRVIREMEKYKVSYVVINQRLADEQGYPVFGQDYGQAVWTYIGRNYELVRQFGPFPFTSEEYGIAVFKRK